MSKSSALSQIQKGHKIYLKTQKPLRKSFLMIRSGVHSYVLEELRDTNAKSILDIGCGQGSILSRLAKSKIKRSLYGLDKDLGAFGSLKKRSRKLGIVVSKGESGSIPFKRKFDLIFTSLSYHEWADKEDSIKHILKRLNKGGKFIIYDFSQFPLKPFRKKYRGFKVKILRDKPLIRISFEAKP